MEVPRKGDVSLGTTIMAVRYKDGVILGADSRTSGGSYVVDRTADKITPLTKSVYCCRSGSASDTQVIAGIVKEQLLQHEIELGKPSTVKTAAKIMQSFLYEYKDQLQAGIIVAGYDELRGGQVFSLPLGGACVEQNYAIGGSGSTYIFGYCDANYKENMTEEEAISFVRTAISHAIMRDGSSGGVVRTMTLSGSKTERTYTPGDELPFPPLPSKDVRV
eukprot:snap_masked-scaffold_24-processed-gene-1.13-mRNA-1 protein AED:0.04 eAED:0.04 QI:0/-1/0/1/-1/1/1/0/218